MDNIDPNDKGSDWVAQAGRAIIYRYNNGNCMLNAPDIARLSEIRNYSNGQQSVNKYMDAYAGAGQDRNEQGNQGTAVRGSSKKANRKGYANINWEIVKFAPLIQRVVTSLIGTKLQRVDLEALSPEAKNRKLVMKYQSFVEAKLSKVLKEAGMAVKEAEFQPQDKVELELFEMLGGYNLSFEIAAKKIIKHGFDISNYHKDIEKSLKQDAYNFNFVVAKIYTDPTTGASKVRYVDPARFVMAYIEEARGQNTPFAGDFRRMSIPEFRTLVSQYVPQEQVEAIVCAAAEADWKSQGTQTNTNWNWFQQVDSVTNRFRYDGMSVDVLEFEYITTNHNYYKKRDRDGYQTFFQDRFGEVVNSEKKKTVVVCDQTIYEGYYIPAIDKGFGGKQTNIMRRDKRTPVLSYSFQKISGTAIGESLIPIWDALQICWLKLQAARLAAKPKGIAVELASINSITLGNATAKPTDLIQIYNESGVIYYKAQLVQGKVVAGGMPIQELEGGIGRQGAEWVQQMANDINLAFQISGVTPIMGASPDTSGEKLVGVANAEREATINNLAPLQEALEDLYAQVAERLLMKVMVVANADASAKEYYEGIVGKDQMDNLLLATGLTLQEMGITISPRVSPDRIQAVLDGVNKAIAVGRNGMPTATVSDQIKILDMLHNGFIEEAARYLQWVEQKRIEQANQQASAASQQQAEQLQMLEQTKLSGQAELKKLEAQIEVQKEMQLSAIRIAEERAKIQEEMKADAYLLELEALVQIQTGKDTGTKIPIDQQLQTAI
jgi:hypothetical protein